jgi:hypothetical protein
MRFPGGNRFSFQHLLSSRDADHCNAEAAGRMGLRMFWKYRWRRVRIGNRESVVDYLSIGIL